MNLEEVTPSNEVAESTPSEGTKSTQTGDKTTVRKYSQKELDTAVGKGSSSINSLLTVQKAATESAKADAEASKASVEAIETELQNLNKKHDDLVEKQFEDDPKARDAYIDRRAIADERSQLLKDKAEVKKLQLASEQALWQAGMGLKAQQLAAEIPGLDPKWLMEGCQSEAEMEVKALRNKPEKPEEEQQFDSTQSSGSGTGKLTPEWIESHTMEEYANHPEVKSRYK